MEKTRSLKAKMMGALAVAALAGSMLVMATPAFALSDDTSVFLKTGNDQISVTIPGDITATVNSDGNLILPEATVVAFENTSIFGIHVDTALVTSEAAYNIVSTSEFAAATDSNSLRMTLAPSAGTQVEIASLETVQNLVGWNMGKVDSGTAELQITASGAIKNIDHDIPTTGEKAFGITWVVSPGADS